MLEQRSAMTVDVAVGNAGEDDFNTIALAGVDVVIPLERDAVDDPFQDDEVRLRSEDGSFEHTLCVDSADVEETDGGLLLYRFRSVPRGVYRVWICVGAQWTEVMRGLVVCKAGVHHQGAQLRDELE